MKKVFIFTAGVVLGMFVLGISAVVLMPKAMIVSHESRYGFDETVRQIEQNIKKAGWSHKGTSLISEEINTKMAQGLNARIAAVKLCKASYATDILREERSRFASCLMPCTISVWESDAGKVYVSKMNTSLMGKLFGGKIAEIMAGKVGPEEQSMLKDIIKQN